MPTPDDHVRIPDVVPGLPLSDLDLRDLEKGERIGTGGDADVYRATVERGGRQYPVAIKEPRFEGTIQERAVQKFEREAETWDGLDDHDNVVTVYAWGMDPLPWLALEYMDGGTLEQRIGRADPSEALWLAGRIAEGVRYGHRHGVAHLDVKPANVLLTDTGDGTWNYPKVSDWGLAKLLLEHSKSVEGLSPTYAAPEQFDPEEYGSPDDITDVYQLGTVAYALLAGEPPFSGPSTRVMRSVLDDDPRPPSELDSGVPPAVDDVVLKALEKRKADRYEGILPFRQELDRLFHESVDGELGGAGPGPLPSDGRSRAGDSRTGDRSDRPSGAAARRRRQRRERATAEGSPGDAQADASGGDAAGAGDTAGESGGSEGPIARRHVLGLLGIGAVGAGGWLAATELLGGARAPATGPVSGDPTATSAGGTTPTPTAGAGGTGGGSDPPRLAVASSPTTHEIANKAGEYWNTNFGPNDGEYWGSSESRTVPGWEELGSPDAHLADYFASRYGFEPTGTRGDPRFAVAVEEENAGQGCGALQQGQVDVGSCFPSIAGVLPISEAKAKETYVDHVVARTGAVVLVSTELAEAGVARLTREALGAIYLGGVENWSEVGGPDKEVQVLGWPKNSGMHAAFRRFLLGDADTSLAGVDDRYESPDGIAGALQANQGAIAYAPYAVAQDGNAGRPITLEVDGTAFVPRLGAEHSIYDADYPLNRDLHMYTKVTEETPTGTDRREAAFLDMLLTEFGQTVFVENTGYARLPPDDLAAQREKLPDGS